MMHFFPVRPAARWTRVVHLAMACGALAAAGCAPRYLKAPPVDMTGRSLPASALTHHVLVISIDGLRPDAIAAFPAPTLQRLAREGSFTLAASTILPSKTLPSHTSMLTGELPDQHHVLWNRAVATPAGSIDVPTVFGVARAHGYRTAAFFSKAKFGLLQRPGTLDYSQAPGGWFGRWSAARTATDVETYLATARPHLLFVHLPDPDAAGHRSGWMSPDYGRAVSAADAAVERILATSIEAHGQGNLTVIVTADHGGHDADHGSDDPRDVTIPWIAWGRGVRGVELRETAVRTVDTASTVLWLLGLPEPTDWSGSPVAEAFRERDVDATASTVALQTPPPSSAQ